MGFQDQIPSHVQGASHARLFIEGKGKRPLSQLYLHIPYGRPALGLRGVRPHTHTFMISRMPDEAEYAVLYDNQNDPYQLKNIAPENPSLVRELIRSELTPLLERTRDPWLKSGGL